MKKSGAALLAALQIISLILIGFLLPFGSGPQQQSADVNAGPGTNQAQTETQTAVRQPLTAADKRALRASAVFANKLYEPSSRPSPPIARITRTFPTSIFTAPASSPAKLST
ncbi:MAG: hypothetical protein DME90_02510 [Verrucomicrobia bacterium]|nr:MAG: hypothetical protein DME90_02510 [Verrucomicrobiota bacterium]